MMKLMPDNNTYSKLTAPFEAFAWCCFMFTIGTGLLWAAVFIVLKLSSFIPDQP